jgi:hypothetical protein
VQGAFRVTDKDKETEQAERADVFKQKDNTTLDLG